MTGPRPELEIRLERCTVRSWRESDAPSLARHANSHAVWRNLRDAFPHPYGLADAERFIAGARQGDPEVRFAIAVDGQAIGGLGVMLQSDVERIGAEIGYFLGEAFWGRGIATEAVRAFTRHIMAAHGLERVFALPYATNPASARVLEKAGFVLEGRMRRSAIKEGRVVDQLMYSYIAGPAGP